MKKEILISVISQYASLLVDGIKRFELRKKFPIDLEEDTKLYIYSSRQVKQVIGHVSVKKVHKLPINELWSLTAGEAMIPWCDFRDYFEGKEFGYGIEVYRPCRYSEPIPLGEFTSGKVKRPPQSYQYVNFEDLKLPQFLLDLWEEYKENEKCD